MVDLNHQWGSDLAVGSTGDLGISDPDLTATQRVYRRLLTNPGDYVWHLAYGAGLSSFVGQAADTNGIEAVVRNQLQSEAVVAASPAPTVNTTTPDRANGLVNLTIRFADAETGRFSQVALGLNA